MMPQFRKGLAKCLFIDWPAPVACDEYLQFVPTLRNRPSKPHDATSLQVAKPAVITCSSTMLSATPPAVKK